MSEVEYEAKEQKNRIARRYRPFASCKHGGRDVANYCLD
jgi:hypothetical protein